MSETIFQQIIKRTIPADIVYENEDVLAFLDIKPVNPGATLVVPKKWSRNVLDIDSASWSALMKAVRIIAPAVKTATNAGGINIIMNNEPIANQAVFHSHIHIIPRHENDGVVDWIGNDYSSEEIEKTAEKIRKVLLT